MADARVLDLFCGAGGMSSGFAAAGFDVVAGVDVDSDALATFHAAHVGVFPVRLDLIGDDKAVKTCAALAKKLGVNVIIGGPPCPDFSTSGKKAGDKGKRNGFPAAIEAVRLIHPDVFVYENVPGFLSFKEYSASVIAELSAIGYRVHVMKLLAADYGVPQSRMRVFVVGVRNDVDARPESFVPMPTHDKHGRGGLQKHVGWGTCVDWAIPIDKPATAIVKKHVAAWLEREAKKRANDRQASLFDGPMLVRLDSDGKHWGQSAYPPTVPSPTISQSGGGPRTALASPQVLVAMCRNDGGDSDFAEDAIRVPGAPAHTVRGAKSTTGAVLVSGKQHSQDLNIPVFESDRPSKTITVHGDDESVVAVDDLTQRALEPFELAAIQGFPVGYPFSGNLTSMRQQIGNAVPPMLAEKIAEKIVAVLVTAEQVIAESGNG